MNKNVLLLSAGFFLISLGFTGPHRFTTILFQEAGKPQLGFLSLFLIYVFFALTTSVSGRLISRFGPKISMILASVSYAVYVAVLPVFHPIVMMVMSIAVGISAAFLWSSQSLYLVSVSQKQTRGLSAGIFSAGNSLASFLSVIFLGFILERLALGRSIIFAAVSLFGFLGVAVLGLLSPDKLKKPGVKKNTVDWRMVFRSPTQLK